MEQYRVGEIDVGFAAPMSLVVAGPSGVGKTKFVRKFLENASRLMNGATPRRVYWYYAYWQSDYAEMSADLGVVFRQGLPSGDDLAEGEDCLVVMDDLSYEGGALIARDMFTKLVHHKRMSVIYIVQNVFAQSKG